MATINNYQITTYAPYLQLNTSSSIIDENTCRISWNLRIIHSAYSSDNTWGTIPYEIYFDGHYVTSGNATTGKSTATIASGTYDVARTTTKSSVALSFKANYSGKSWSGVGGTEKTLTETQEIAKKLSAPTSCTHVRNGDNQNTVSWTKATTGGTPTSFVIERTVNGGAWSEIARVSNSATSYIDATTIPDCYYSYRVGAFDAGAPVASAASATTYNTPAPPNAIDGARIDGSVIGFTVDNTSATATGLDVQYSQNGVDTWTDIPSIAGTPVTSFVYSIGGTHYFRARNTRGNLKSDWTKTENAIVSLAKPNTPTITSPNIGAVLTRGASIAFSWVHNPADDTAQTKAEYGFSVNGGAWSSTVVTTASSIAYSAPTVGSLSFRVRTKGAKDEWSDWTTATYTIADAPTVSFKELSSTISAIPIHYELTYIDSGYAFAGGTLYVELNGVTVYSETLDGLTGDILASEFAPKNNTSYTVRVEVRSSSSLSSSTSATITTQFIPPEKAQLNIELDAETGYANIRLDGFITETGHTTAVNANVYRVVDGVEKLVGQGLTRGVEIVDKYAPLNKKFTYRAVSFSQAGSTEVKDYEQTIETNRFFAYWGNKIAFAIYQPGMSVSHSRPQRKLIHYDSRPDPVLYDGTNHSEQYNASFTLFESDGGVASWVELMRDGGVCVFKAASGEVFHSCITLNETYAFEPNDKWGKISLAVTKIDGDDL